MPSPAPRARAVRLQPFVLLGSPGFRLSLVGGAEREFERRGRIPIGRHAGLAQFDALGEFGPKHVLAVMTQVGMEIDIDLAADVAPAPAEGIVFGKVPSRIGVDHAVKEQPAVFRFGIVREPVGNVVELWIIGDQLGKYVPLDDHESGRRFGDLDEIVLRDEVSDRLGAAADEIERIF